MSHLEGIYVIEFADGRIKIGRSAKLGNRLRHHAGVVESYGMSVVNIWSALVDDSEAAEVLLKRMLRAHPNATSTTSGEAWEGVPFVEVVTTALAMLGGRRRFALGQLPADPECDVPWPPEFSEDDVQAAQPTAAALSWLIDLAGGVDYVPESEVRASLGNDRDALIKAQIKPRRRKLPDGTAVPVYLVAEARRACLELGWHPDDFGTARDVRTVTEGS